MFGELICLREVVCCVIGKKLQRKWNCHFPHLLVSTALYACAWFVCFDDTSSFSFNFILSEIVVVAASSLFLSSMRKLPPFSSPNRILLRNFGCFRKKITHENNCYFPETKKTSPMVNSVQFGMISWLCLCQAGRIMQWDLEPTTALKILFWGGSMWWHLPTCHDQEGINQTNCWRIVREEYVFWKWLQFFQFCAGDSKPYLWRYRSLTD